MYKPKWYWNNIIVIDFYHTKTQPEFEPQKHLVNVCRAAELRDYDIKDNWLSIVL